VADGQDALDSVLGHHSGRGLTDSNSTVNHKDRSVVTKLKGLSMGEGEKKFGYRADSSKYWPIAGVLIGLALIEGGLGCVLIFYAGLSSILRLVLLVGIVLLFTVPLGLIFAPLFTRHRLTPSQLVIHYGRHKLMIPRSMIGTVQDTRDPVDGFAVLGARREGQQKRISMCFSERGQILLRLVIPLIYRGVEIHQVIFNVDEPEELINLLQPSMVVMPAKAGARAVNRLAPVERMQLEMSGLEKCNVAIRTEALGRSFNSFIAVDQLNLQVLEGEIYGFLGLNGAGKTTTLKMLVGLLRPTQGKAYVCGHDVWDQEIEAKSCLGYLPDRSILYDRLTGREFLEYISQMRNLSRSVAEDRIREMFDLLDLTPYANRLCGQYSLGIKRKLSLAAALLHSPSVLLLDEPFNGLDPKSARTLKNTLLAMAGRKTIFLSTHDLTTAEEMCHRVGILHRGRLVAEGPPSLLRETSSGAKDLEEVFLALTFEPDAE